MSATDLTLVQLPPRPWSIFYELVTRPTGKHQSGGFQNRLRKWRSRMDVVNHTILLSHHSSSPRELDDMTWIAHAIADRNVGGWQKHVFDIFAGCHPRFTGITIKPRKGRKQNVTSSQHDRRPSDANTSTDTGTGLEHPQTH